MGEEQGFQNYNDNRIFLVYGSSDFSSHGVCTYSSWDQLLILLIIARLVFGYVARKEGYVERAKELSPKYYYYARRVEVIVYGGLFTGFAIIITLRVLYGPLPYPHSFLLFIILIAVGAYIGDIVGRKLDWINKDW